VEGTPSATQTVATFTDPGGAEGLADYSSLIDWGDGTAPSAGTITGPDAGGVFTVTASHTYATGLGLPADFGNTFCDANAPSYHKPITVTISHEAATKAVANDTATISLPPASAHLAGGSLIVVGTTGNDQFVFTPVGNTGAVSVMLNNAKLGSFSLGAGGRIITAAMSGNDDIQVAGGVRLNAVLYGGPGNDRIKGGGGQNIEVGCEGSDDLLGGNDHDLLVGGAGADNLNGTAGGDTLIAGLLLDATLAEDDKYLDLVSVLNNTAAANPVAAAGLSAGDDGAVDTLQGASGGDTLYYRFSGGGTLDVVHGKVEHRFKI
jgi:Ca2+-binding RTX toxin-like protein